MLHPSLAVILIFATLGQLTWAGLIPLALSEVGLEELLDGKSQNQPKGSKAKNAPAQVDLTKEQGNVDVLGIKAKVDNPMDAPSDLPSAVNKAASASSATSSLRPAANQAANAANNAINGPKASPPQKQQAANAQPAQQQAQQWQSSQAHSQQWQSANAQPQQQQQWQQQQQAAQDAPNQQQQRAKDDNILKVANLVNLDKLSLDAVDKPKKVDLAPLSTSL